MLELEDDSPKVELIFLGKSVHCAQRQSRYDRAHSLPVNTTSHEENYNQVSPLTKRCDKRNCKNPTCGYEVTDIRYFYKTLGFQIGYVPAL